MPRIKQENNFDDKKHTLSPLKPKFVIFYKGYEPKLKFGLKTAFRTLTPFHSE